jgi:hypothetical protein
MLYRQAFLMPFTICLVVSAFVLWFWWSRNPVRKFRPAMGAVVLVGLMLGMVSGGAAYLVAHTVLGGDEMVQQFKNTKQTQKYVGRSDEVPGSAGGKGGSWDRLGQETDADPRELEEQAAAEEAKKNSLWHRDNSK